MSNDPYVITDAEGETLAYFTTEVERDEALLTGDYPDDAEPAYISDPTDEDGDLDRCANGCVCTPEEKAAANADY